VYAEGSQAVGSSEAPRLQPDIPPTASPQVTAPLTAAQIPASHSPCSAETPVAAKVAAAASPSEVVPPALTDFPIATSLSPAAAPAASVAHALDSPTQVGTPVATTAPTPAGDHRPAPSATLTTPQATSSLLEALPGASALPSSVQDPSLTGNTHPTQPGVESCTQVQQPPSLVASGVVATPTLTDPSRPLTSFPLNSLFSSATPQPLSVRPTNALLTTPATADSAQVTPAEARSMQPAPPPQTMDTAIQHEAAPLSSTAKAAQEVSQPNELGKPASLPVSTPPCKTAPSQALCARPQAVPPQNPSDSGISSATDQKVANPADPADIYCNGALRQGHLFAMEPDTTTFTMPMSSSGSLPSSTGALHKEASDSSQWLRTKHGQDVQGWHQKASASTSGPLKRGRAKGIMLPVSDLSPNRVTHRRLWNAYAAVHTPGGTTTRSLRRAQSKKSNPGQSQEMLTSRSHDSFTTTRSRTNSGAARSRKLISTAFHTFARKSRRHTFRPHNALPHTLVPSPSPRLPPNSCVTPLQWKVANRSQRRRWLAAVAGSSNDSSRGGRRFVSPLLADMNGLLRKRSPASIAPQLAAAEGAGGQKPKSSSSGVAPLRQDSGHRKRASAVTMQAWHTHGKEARRKPCGVTPTAVSVCGGEPLGCGLEGPPKNGSQYGKGLSCSMPAGLCQNGSPCVEASHESSLTPPPLAEDTLEAPFTAGAQGAVHACSASPCVQVLHEMMDSAGAAASPAMEGGGTERPFQRCLPSDVSEDGRVDAFQPHVGACGPRAPSVASPQNAVLFSPIPVPANCEFRAARAWHHWLHAARHRLGPSIACVPRKDASSSPVTAAPTVPMPFQDDAVQERIPRNDAPRAIHPVLDADTPDTPPATEDPHITAFAASMPAPDTPASEVPRAAALPISLRALEAASSWGSAPQRQELLRNVSNLAFSAPRMLSWEPSRESLDDKGSLLSAAKCTFVRMESDKAIFQTLDAQETDVPNRNAASLSSGAPSPPVTVGHDLWGHNMAGAACTLNGAPQSDECYLCDVEPGAEIGGWRGSSSRHSEHGPASTLGCGRCAASNYHATRAAQGGLVQGVLSGAACDDAVSGPLPDDAAEGLFSVHQDQEALGRQCGALDDLSGSEGGNDADLMPSKLTQWDHRAEQSIASSDGHVSRDVRGTAADEEASELLRGVWRALPKILCPRKAPDTASSGHLVHSSAAMDVSVGLASDFRSLQSAAPSQALTDVMISQDHLALEIPGIVAMNNQSNAISSTAPSQALTDAIMAQDNEAPAVPREALADTSIALGCGNTQVPGVVAPGASRKTQQNSGAVGGHTSSNGHALTSFCLPDACVSNACDKHPESTGAGNGRLHTPNAGVDGLVLPHHAVVNACAAQAERSILKGRSQKDERLRRGVHEEAIALPHCKGADSRIARNAWGDCNHRDSHAHVYPADRTSSSPDYRVGAADVLRHAVDGTAADLHGNDIDMEACTHEDESGDASHGQHGLLEDDYFHTDGGTASLEAGARQGRTGDALECSGIRRKGRERRALSSNSHHWTAMPRCVHRPACLHMDADEGLDTAGRANAGRAMAPMDTAHRQRLLWTRSEQAEFNTSETSTAALCADRNTELVSSAVGADVGTSEGCAEPEAPELVELLQPGDCDRRETRSVELDALASHLGKPQECRMGRARKSEGWNLALPPWDGVHVDSRHGVAGGEGEQVPRQELTPGVGQPLGAHNAASGWETHQASSMSQSSKSDKERMARRMQMATRKSSALSFWQRLEAEASHADKV
jgi:hypothetical protein